MRSGLRNLLDFSSTSRLEPEIDQHLGRLRRMALGHDPTRVIVVSYPAISLLNCIGSNGHRCAPVSGRFSGHAPGKRHWHRTGHDRRGSRYATSVGGTRPAAGPTSSSWTIRSRPRKAMSEPARKRVGDWFGGARSTPE
jgi:hypothetical protein